MSTFVMLMIGGWTSAVGVIVGFALVESVSLIEVHRRIGVWLENSTPRLSMPEQSLQIEEEKLA